jgi:hypothetical protein
MAKAKHTQGPWAARYIIAPEAVLTGWHIKSTNEAGTPVCVVPETIGGIKNKQGQSPFQTANAALIAAAPELLAVLERSLATIETLLRKCPDSNDVVSGDLSVRNADIRAAIAKAKGGSK